LAGRSGATKGATSGLGGIEIEDESEIGFALCDGVAVYEGYLFHREATGIALENGGGVVEAVGNDPVSSSKGGMDELADELRSAGGEKQKFRFGGHGLAHGIVFEEVANDFPHWGAAGFTDLVHG